MSDRARWEMLVCACGSDRFEKLYTLRRHPQGGLSEDAAGMRCAACQTVTDTGALWQALRRRQLLEQLRTLEAQLGTPASALTTAASSPASNA